jgi:hypothetical protein
MRTLCSITSHHVVGGGPVFLLAIETPTVMADIAIAISLRTQQQVGRAKRPEWFGMRRGTTESRAKQPPQQGRSLTNFERHPSQPAIEVRILSVTWERFLREAKPC